MKQKKHTYIYGILLFCLILTLNVRLYPLVIHNGVGTAYGDTGPKASLTSNTIEDQIINAASYFLDASNQINQLLNHFELQAMNTIDTTTLVLVADNALVNIQKTKDIYGQIIKQAENSLYNPTVIKALANFPYETVGQQESLNTTILAEVETYLKNGNVTGVFKRTYDSLATIEGLLQNFKTQLNTDPNTAVSLAWDVNETTDQVLMFGSYVARVFAAL